MNDIKTLIAGVVGDYLASHGADGIEVMPLFETPSDPSMGDVALPCFKFSKALRNAPQKIAAELAESFAGNTSVKANPVGGYLNFFISRSLYSAALAEEEHNEGFGRSTDGEGKVICLDYSSPNIAKRFHLGHLGTTAIGNCLRNIFDFLGYKTVAINYIGDWGTQFGKLSVAYKKWSSKERVEQYGVKELEDIYVRFGKEAAEDPSLVDEARASFAALERGDPELLAIWQQFKDISLKEYKKTYDLMGIEFDSYCGESFFTDKMPAIVQELKDKNMLKIDNGASIVDLSEYNMPPCLILKTDGSTLYPTRDIAAAKWRKQEYNFDKCIYVTSAGQSLHFAQWFKVVELMGYDWYDGLVHVPYGTMSMGGEKIASRTGNVVHLDDLLQEAITKCENIIAEKNSSIADRRSVAEAVGVGAVIFGALSSSRIKDTDFNWDDALSFEGNSGPYLQYTYARCCSVLRKTSDEGDYSGYEPDGAETELVKKALEFPSIVKRAGAEYEPSVIARYALSLCALYNQFYHGNTILGSEGKTRYFRLALTRFVRQILGSCLALLGMRATEEI